MEEKIGKASRHCVPINGMITVKTMAIVREVSPKSNPKE
jgi:hypothetical protein